MAARARLTERAQRHVPAPLPTARSTMNDYTPGPWNYRYETATIEADDGFMTVAGVYTADDMPWQESLANAHLIVAAPELRDALAAMLPLIDSLLPEQCDQMDPMVRTTVERCIEMAEDALTRADGRGGT